MTETDLLTFVVLIAASYRITRLIVLDEILGVYPDDEHPRGTGLRHLWDVFLYDDDGRDRGPVRGWLGRLTSCPWCVGVWVSLALVCVWFALWPHELGVDGWVWVAAVAGGQGYLGSRVNA